MSRPEIFRYHDYRAFLKDWLAYRKASQSDFSLRTLARQAGLAAGYLPMVLNGKRPLTAKALAKLLPFLGLNPTEQSFLENLITLGTTDTHEARLTALERMKRFQLYRKHNPRETEVYEYLTHWYYVAIREMASLEGFRLDPEWIQAQLRFPVPLQEIKAAIDFLLASGYLELASDGSVRPPEKLLDCTGDVYRVALGKFHREIFELIAHSIEETPREERNVQGHTLALDGQDYARASEILEEALKKLRTLGKKAKNADTVYHVEVALFPLTKITQRRNRK